VHWLVGLHVKIGAIILCQIGFNGGLGMAPIRSFKNSMHSNGYRLDGRFFLWKSEQRLAASIGDGFANDRPFRRLVFAG
jgi:hypothetical protein